MPSTGESAVPRPRPIEASEASRTPMAAPACTRAAPTGSRSSTCASAGDERAIAARTIPGKGWRTLTPLRQRQQAARQKLSPIEREVRVRADDLLDRADRIVLEQPHEQDQHLDREDLRQPEMLVLVEEHRADAAFGARDPL